MEETDRDVSVIRDTITRAKAENIKEKIQDLSVSQPEPPSGEQLKHRLRTLRNQVGDPKEARKRLERVLKGDDLTDINYLAQGFLRARAVCRIVICCDGAEEGYGTGFLIAPGVLMTNYHVLRSLNYVRESYAQFSYERDFRGNITPVRFALRTSPEPILSEELDMAIASVERNSSDGKQLDEYGWLKLSGQPGKAFIGEYLTAIQHPRGEPKQVCVRENKLLKYAETDPFVWYQTDTDAGSSGSPVFNNSWEVVALHHSSVPRMNDRGEWLTRKGQLWKKGEMSDDLIDWIANEGVRVSRIVEFLQKKSLHPLADAVLNAPVPPADDWFRSLGTGSSSRVDTGSGASVGNIQVRSDGDGVTRIVVPIEISVKVGVGGYENAGPDKHSETSRVTIAQTPAPPPLPAFEKVDVDQTNYPLRNGYAPGFLGEGLIVPLPLVTERAMNNFGNVETLTADAASSELKYWNYSVVMNRDRRIAYFSAANLDTSRKLQGRDKDRWYKDTRISEAAQLGKEFYEDQPDKFEAASSRAKNPFDQGHLTAFSDLQWGDEAKRNGDDSFHFTNCAPQHWRFNEFQLWRRLEEAAIGQLSKGADKKFCLINGPVFDAPRPYRKQDGSLDIHGQRARDGVIRFKHDGILDKLLIPRLFFKVIAYSVGGQLRAKAFVVSQEDLLEKEAETAKHIEDTFTYIATERTKPFSENEIRLYQVPIVDLQTLTGLDFGSLRDSDRFGQLESFPQGSGVAVEIRNASDLVF